MDFLPTDPDKATLLGKIIGAIVGLGTIAMSALGLRNRAKDKAERAIETRDAAIDERIGRHDRSTREQIELLRRDLDKRKEIEGKLFDLVGIDGPIMAGIDRLTEQTGQFQAEVLREFGKRPTRDEVERMVDRG